MSRRVTRTTCALPNVSATRVDRAPPNTATADAAAIDRAMPQITSWLVALFLADRIERVYAVQLSELFLERDRVRLCVRPSRQANPKSMEPDAIPVLLVRTHAFNFHVANP